MKKETNIKYPDQKNEVEKIIRIEDYAEAQSPSNGYQVRFTIDSYELNFDLLENISKIYKTKNINIEHDTRTEGYCETCSYTRTVIELYISDIGSIK